jgi:hypothetical protein
MKYCSTEAEVGIYAHIIIWDSLLHLAFSSAIYSTAPALETIIINYHTNEETPVI